MKITAKSKRILGTMVLLALPLVLFAVIREQNSWRPQVFVTLRQHSINWVSSSPEGKMVGLFSANLAKPQFFDSVSIWKVKPKAMRWQNDLVISPGAFSADGKTLLGTGVAARFPRQFWDVETGQLKSQRGQGSSTAIAVYGSMVADSVFRGPVQIWHTSNSKSRPPILLGERESCYRALDFSPDGKILAAGGYKTKGGYLVDGIASGKSHTPIYSVRFWNIETRKVIHVLQGFTEEITSVKFSPDGKILLTASANQIQLWSLQTFKSLSEITDRITVKRRNRFFSPYEKAKFSPDGTTIASNSGDVIKLRDAHTLKLLRVLKAPHGTVNAFAFAPDGNTLMTGHDDGTVLIWRVR